MNFTIKSNLLVNADADLQHEAHKVQQGWSLKK